MPVAISFGSLEPDSVMLWNVMIMPITVPTRPSSGPAATASRRKAWKRSSRGTSRSTASEMRSSATSASSSMLTGSPLRRQSTRPSGLSLVRLVEMRELTRHGRAHAHEVDELIRGEQAADDADRDDDVADGFALLDSFPHVRALDDIESSTPRDGSTTACT